MGLPCGQVVAPVLVRMRSSTSGEMTCSHECASSWARCHGISRMSTSRRSARRWRRTRGVATSRPSALRVISRSAMDTSPSFDRRRTCSETAGADLRTTSGQPTNAVYGFTSMLIKAWQDHKSRYLAVAFDRGAPLERLAIRPEYKAQRQTPPDEFRQQVGLIREVLKVLAVPVFEMDNVEADDIIHVLGSQLAAEGATAVVVTA